MTKALRVVIGSLLIGCSVTLLAQSPVSGPPANITQIPTRKFSDLQAKPPATSIIFVDTGGNDSSGIIGRPELPFATLGAAVTAAQAASPTAANPILIQLGAGVFAQASAINITSSYITVAGAGGKTASVVSLSGSAGLTISAAHTQLRNFQLIRSGANAAFVLHCAVTSLATWLDDIRFDGITVTNTSGTAIGTLTAESHGIYAYGMTAVDYNYGGRNFNSVFFAHDPALTSTTNAITYAVKYSQACANTSYTVGVESHAARFEGCTLMNFDPRGVGINGITESTTGDHTTLDWYTHQDGSSGNPAVSSFPTQLVGCLIYAPVTGGSYTGTIDGGAIRGTLAATGTSVYGTLLGNWVHDSDIVASYFTIGETYVPAIDQFVNVIFDACQFVTGSARVFQRIGACTFTACSIQNDSTEQLRGQQYQFLDCTDTQTDASGQRGIVFGYQSNSPIALRTGGTVVTAAATITTTDYRPVNLTAELWFRATSTVPNNNELLSYADNTATGWLIGVQPNTNQIYAFIGGVGTGAITVASTTFDGSWHHVAITNSGTSAKLWLDGTQIGSATSGSMSGTSRLIIGAGTSGSDVNLAFVGDVTEARISNVVRYTGTFTPANHFTPDANTISLFSNSSQSRLTWTDQMGLHNADFSGGSVVTENYPYWVQSYALSNNKAIGFNTSGLLLSGNNLSDVGSAASSRTNLGLGTAATQNTGTSGANVPLLNAANTWASGQVFVAPVLGTPASGVLTNATGLPISTGISGLGTGIATWLGTPAEANLKSAQSGLAWLDTAQSFTANQTISSASLTLSGNQSVAAWTTSGVRLKGVAGTLTDTTSSGTVAAAYTDVLGGNTIAASSATTFTEYASLKLKVPVAGTNVTFTNSYALDADSASIGTSTPVTISNSGVLTATSPVFVTPALGTPASGTLTNCTFPTLNQNTTGSAASLSISGQTGLLTFTGLTSTNRAKTVRDAADTVLELGGSYTPTGTWTSLPLTTPKITTGINDANGNTLLGITATASAVNNVTVANAATTHGPTISAAGTDTNIDLILAGKGTGLVNVGGNTAAQQSGFYTDTTYPNQVSFKNGGTASFRFAQAQLGLVSNGSLTWGNQVNSWSTNVDDTGIKRVSAGLLEIYDGVTAANYRDLKLRTLTLTDTGTASATSGAATLNAQVGVITTEALTTAAGAEYTLTLTNSEVATTSRVFASIANGTNTTTGAYITTVTEGSGSVVIIIHNGQAVSALNGTLKVKFLVL